MAAVDLTGDPVVRPARAGCWDDLAQLFGRVGADGGCWCMYWRLSASGYRDSGRARNEASLRELVESGAQPGLLAYRDDQAVGWCGLGPRDSFERLRRSRHFTRLDDRRVWSVVCFFVHRRHRGHGVARALLDAAVRHVAGQGAEALEGYAVDAGADRLAPTSTYPGTVALFRSAGFTQAAATAARSAGRPRVVMRHDLHGVSG